MSANEGKLDVTSMYISIDDLEKSGEYCPNNPALPGLGCRCPKKKKG